ncbi:Gamma-tubulin complex component 4 [Hibiscus syriacus]|uniref:Gamma-tubulin complex component n=1 Tax=Hibiscus syriacus TaxID=106335 RepID=A0A6A2Y718_HIBSY|nr:Gamma-tubulin complex component 4 [Hibiscus syriacus]
MREQRVKAWLQSPSYGCRNLPAMDATHARGSQLWMQPMHEGAGLRSRLGHRDCLATYKVAESAWRPCRSLGVLGDLMLHELLLALVGYTGDLIINEREHQNSLGIHLYPDAAISGNRCFKLAPDISFKLAPDISFIDPSERDLIERLIALGFHYRELDRFATKSRNLSWIRSGGVSVLALDSTSELFNGENPSVYLRAVANGMVEVLSVYKSAVLQIEQKLLSETIPVLATVTQGLNKFFVILAPLYELVLEIERDDLRGGKLLSLLHKRFHCGVPELQACIQRLLWHGHQVLYNQLASWMVYAVLQDHHGEFFIRRQEDRDVEYGSLVPNTSKKLVRLSSDDKSLRDWHFGFHIFLMNRILLVNFHWQLLRNMVACQENQQPCSVTVNSQDMLPEYIPMHAANSILFAGKSIRILQNPNPGFEFQDALYNTQKGKCSQKVHGSAGRSPFHKEPINGKMVGEEFLPQSEADKIETMLQDLKESLEFHRRSFECSVDSIRAIAAAHLWQLVVILADSNGHLKALKDYFLLCFLEESRQLMCLPPRPSTAEADITVPFQLLFFTQEVLSKYRILFQYLLRLKRTQMELGKSWASVMHQDRTDFAKHRKDRKNCSTSQPRRQRLIPMWHVDVIESQWTVLQSHIRNSHDFAELVGSHQEYLSALFSQSFLDIGSGLGVKDTDKYHDALSPVLQEH